MTVSRVGTTRSGRCGQRGLTLIETLVTVAVLAIGIVGIGAGVAQTENISTTVQTQSQLEVSMRQFADWVRSSSSTTCGSAVGSCPNLPYALCATPAYAGNVTKAISAGALTPASGETLTLLAPVNLSTSGKRSLAGGSLVDVSPLQTCSGSCPGPSCVGDWGVQEITVQVASGVHTLKRIVWKSNGW